MGEGWPGRDQIARRLYEAQDIPGPINVRGPWREGAYLTMADAILALYAEAQRRGEEDIERLLGALHRYVPPKGTADLQQAPIHKYVIRGLKQCIGDHGDAISRERIGSAAKRVVERVSDSLYAVLAASQETEAAQGSKEEAGVIATATARGWAEGIEQAALKAHEWADSKSCTHHDDNPCCHVRTGAGIAAAIRALERA